MRITHRPTGIVVQCQNERSQSSNSATAMAMLRAKLLERSERERQEEIAREKGEAQDVNFGSQIRSYVLHPYTMVKDHRTGHEMGDVQRVLDGDLDGFVRAYLLRRGGAARLARGMSDGRPLSSSALVRRALAEDVGSGDVTTQRDGRRDARARALITQKAPGVIYGLRRRARRVSRSSTPTRASQAAGAGGRVARGRGAGAVGRGPRARAADAASARR